MSPGERNDSELRTTGIHNREEEWETDRKKICQSSGTEAEGTGQSDWSQTAAEVPHPLRQEGKTALGIQELINLHMEPQPAENQPEGLQCPQWRGGKAMC